VHPVKMKRIEAASRGLLRFSVHIVPRASRNQIAGWTSEGLLKVKVTAPPVDNAANQALIKFIAAALSIKKSDICICSGSHARVKQLEVPETCKNRLLSFADI
jgi:uncharacterized protein (TIGR00251 family)